MSVYSNATFSVNSYDKDGDLLEENVQVHLGSTILNFSNVKQIDNFIERLQEISKEAKSGL